jgi:site-specific recombinase XerD
MGESVSTAILTPQAAGLDRIKALVLDGLTSPESKRAYGRALDDFLLWSRKETFGGFTKPTVNAYRSKMLAGGVSAVAINIRLSAVRKLAVEAADNGLIPAEVAAAIGRVKGVKQEGVRTGQWLNLEQAERLISAPHVASMKGKRDRALLAVLVGCGLRRKETAALAVHHIQLREARWVIVDLVGKGGRIRTVPMPSWTKTAIDAWTGAAGITDGLVFRAVNRGGRVTGESMTPQSIFEAIRHYGAMIGVPNLAPHDLRRTFAKLAHKGHAALEQIQLSLGHASVTTTERYLGVRQDLTDAPCDHLGLKVEVPA